MKTEKMKMGLGVALAAGCIVIGSTMPVSAETYEKSDFIGETWYGVDTGYTVEFDDNTMTMKEGDITFYMGWGVEADKIISYTLSGKPVDSFQVSEEDGNIQLIGLSDSQDWNNVDTYVTKGNIPMEQLSVGDIAATDLLEETLSDYGFSDTLGTQFDPYSRNEIKADDGMTFFYAKIHVKNISKQEMSFKSFEGEADYCDYVLNYSDGYEFSTTEESECYCYASNQETGGFQFSSNSGVGGSPKIAPLAEMDIIVAIPCAAVVAQDTESPLSLIVTLPTSSGTAKFKYDLTAGQGNEVTSSASNGESADNGEAVNSEETAPSFELIDGIAFGDSREQVLDKIKSAEWNKPFKFDTVYTSAEDNIIPGYSEEMMTQLAFGIDVEGAEGTVTCEYKGDDGGLVDLFASIGPKGDGDPDQDFFNEFQAKLTEKYGEPEANVDVEHRTEVKGFAVDFFYNTYKNYSSEIKDYVEWNLPESKVKIELFYGQNIMSGDTHHYVFIDYRYQE